MTQHPQCQGRCVDANRVDKAGRQCSHRARYRVRRDGAVRQAKGVDDAEYCLKHAQLTVRQHASQWQATQRRALKRAIRQRIARLGREYAIPWEDFGVDALREVLRLLNDLDLEARHRARQAHPQPWRRP